MDQMIELLAAGAKNPMILWTVMFNVILLWTLFAALKTLFMGLEDGPEFSEAPGVGEPLTEALNTFSKTDKEKRDKPSMI